MQVKSAETQPHYGLDIQLRNYAAKRQGFFYFVLFDAMEHRADQAH